jgi:uncharacterized protein involved in response to NO
MMAIPRYRPHHGAALLSAGFRPFFLAAACWAALAVPLWLAAYAGRLIVPSALPPVVWHVHEMVYGFAAASVAGFLLTAIPNWTGRMPLQGGALALLLLAWVAGRAGVLLSSALGAPAAAILDLAFPALFLAVVAREILAGRNWRNLPMLAALSLLLIGNLLVHLDAVGLAETAELGNRIGIATLLTLITLVGGRIIPSFTRNWLTKAQPGKPPPAPEGPLDRAALVIAPAALALWAADPEAAVTPWAALAAGTALAVRLSRWRGLRTLREPLLLMLHVGYGWLALGLLLLGLNGLVEILPATAALHALTAGAIGTMTLAVMTRASLGHTGRPLAAGSGTKAIYALVTLAAVLRVLSPLAPEHVVLVLALAGSAWSAAFCLFAILYGGPLMQPRVAGNAARPI